MLCTQIVVFVLFWYSEQFWATTCSADVATISASEKDLPVKRPFYGPNHSIPDGYIYFSSQARILLPSKNTFTVGIT